MHLFANPVLDEFVLVNADAFHYRVVWIIDICIVEDSHWLEFLFENACLLLSSFVISFPSDVFDIPWWKCSRLTATGRSSFFIFLSTGVSILNIQLWISCRNIKTLLRLVFVIVTIQLIKDKLSLLSKLNSDLVSSINV